MGAFARGPGRKVLTVNLPNLITLLRLFAVPLLVWLILGNHLIFALWVFVAAGVSDALDGLIAKKFDLGTVLGSFLDPLADKALLVSVYVTLGYKGDLPTWLVIAVVFRDLVIIGGALLFHTVTQSLTMEPLKISKANTVAQIVLAAVTLAGHGYGLQLDLPIHILIYLVAATTVASGLAYVVTWNRRASAIEESRQ